MTRRAPPAPAPAPPRPAPDRFRATSARVFSNSRSWSSYSVSRGVSPAALVTSGFAPLVTKYSQSSKYPYE